MKKEIVIVIVILLVVVIYFSLNEVNEDENRSKVSERQIDALLENTNYEFLEIEEFRDKTFEGERKKIALRVNITKMPSEEVPYLIWEYPSPAIKILIDERSEVEGEFDKEAYDYEVVLLGEHYSVVSGSGVLMKNEHFIDVDKIVFIRALECYCDYRGTSREYCLPPDRFCV